MPVCCVSACPLRCSTRHKSYLQRAKRKKSTWEMRYTVPVPCTHPNWMPYCTVLEDEDTFSEYNTRGTSRTIHICWYSSMWWGRLPTASDIRSASRLQTSRLQTPDAPEYPEFVSTWRSTVHRSTPRACTSSNVRVRRTIHDKGVKSWTSQL